MNIANQIHQTEDDLARRVAKKRNRELLLDIYDHILIIKINRPKSKNVLGRNAVHELIRAFSEATRNADIKLVVLAAAGDTFCAGADLKEVHEYKNPDDYHSAANYILKTLITTILFCPKIVICMVNGPCIGIGFTMAVLCDVVYCSKDAYFQTPFTQLGLCPEACSSVTFPQMFGRSWSSKLLLFNEKLSAEKAEQLGFVAEIFEDQTEVEEKFWYKLKVYAELSWDSLGITKRLIRMQNKMQLLRALEVELKELGKLRRGEVYQRAITEFVQRSINKSKL